MRLLRSGLSRDEIQPRLRELVTRMYQNIPSGVGRGREDLRLGRPELRKVLRQGASWAISRGMGDPDDLHYLEEMGCIAGADPDLVSDRAMARGRDQLGTLGSGNHFAEVQVVSEIFDEDAAAALGLWLGQVAVTLHTGSRGLGHQVCTDHLKEMVGAGRRYGFELPDKQLCCAPIDSPEGRSYLSAMAAAANYAFVNRQVLTHWVRQSFYEALGIGPSELAMGVVYDVCHNIAKFERFKIDGRMRTLCVHRKGATRAYPPGHPQTPEAYREVGQPVLIPGDMGRYSYVLVGTERAYRHTFGSTCHGAGRRLSRRQAKRQARGRNLLEEMERRGVVVMAAGMATVAEEMPEAYKDVADVVDVVDRAGIGHKVAKLQPVGVVKG